MIFVFGIGLWHLPIIRDMFPPCIYLLNSQGTLFDYSHPGGQEVMKEGPLNLVHFKSIVLFRGSFFLTRDKQEIDKKINIKKETVPKVPGASL